MRRFAVSVLAGALILGACTSPATDRSASGAGEGRDPRAADPSQGSQGAAKIGSAGTVESRAESDRKGEQRAPDEGPSSSREPKGDGGEEGSERAPRPDSAEKDPARAGDRRSRPQPDSGRYTYAQQGWEEFCAGTCRRSDLPPTESIDTRVSPDGDALRVVSESRASEERSVTTTYRLTSDALAITRVQLRYGSFSNTYEPTPPVRSLQLPLGTAERWSGRWEADTSGDYSVEILGREGLVVDGRRIETYKLDTVTHFRGQFEGKMIATLWVDPDTTTPIRSSGKIRLSTSYGRFNSDFDTMLIEGPGY